MDGIENGVGNDVDDDVDDDLGNEWCREWNGKLYCICPSPILSYISFASHTNRFSILDHKSSCRSCMIYIVQSSHTIPTPSSHT